MPAAARPLADARVVEDLGDGPAVRPAAEPRRTPRSRGPTRAGCSCSSSRGRASSTSRAKPAVSPMSRSTRSAMSVISSRVKPTWPSSGPGVGSVRSSCSRVRRRRRTSRPNRRAEPGGQPREQRPGDQRDRGQHADRGRQQRPDGERPAADVDLVRRRAQRPRGPAPAAGAPPASSSTTLLDDPVLRAHHDRAERDEVGVGRPPVVHGDGEEPGGAERLGVRGDLLEVPAERLLALVDAEHRLEPRRGRGVGAGLRGVQGEGVERPGVEAPLVGQVEDPPPLDAPENASISPTSAGPLRRRSAGAAPRASSRAPGRAGTPGTPAARRSAARRRPMPPPQLVPQLARAGRCSRAPRGPRAPAASRSRSSRTARNSTRLPCGTGWTARSGRSSRNRIMPAQPRRASSVADRNVRPTRPPATPRIVERLADRLAAGRRLRPPAGPAPSASPRRHGSGGPPGWRYSAKNAGKKPGVAAGQRPVREPLVEERGAEPDQQVVDQQVGVAPGRFEQQVAVPDRRRRGR